MGVSDDAWWCSNCGSHNRPSAVICYTCGELRTLGPPNEKKWIKRPASSRNDPLLDEPDVSGYRVDGARQINDTSELHREIQQRSGYIPPSAQQQAQTEVGGSSSEIPFMVQDQNQLLNEVKRNQESKNHSGHSTTEEPLHQKELADNSIGAEDREKGDKKRKDRKNTKKGREEVRGSKTQRKRAASSFASDRFNWNQRNVERQVGEAVDEPKSLFAAASRQSMHTLTQKNSPQIRRYHDEKERKNQKFSRSKETERKSSSASNEGQEQKKDSIRRQRDRIVKRGENRPSITAETFTSNSEQGSVTSTEAYGQSSSRDVLDVLGGVSYDEESSIENVPSDEVSNTRGSGRGNSLKQGQSPVTTSNGKNRHSGGELTRSAPKTVESFGSVSSHDMEYERLQRLARVLSPTWFGRHQFSKQYATKLVNFKYAQEKRRKTYGYETPYGVLGLYEHLSSIRADIAWAEEVERRKENHEPHISWSNFDELQDDLMNSPFFTYLLVLICTLTFIVSIKMNGWKLEPFSTNPTFGPSGEVLISMGAKQTDLIVNEGETWRLITPMFLHAGIIHYVINMIALNAIGKAVEQAHGSFAACIMFCLPAIGGTIVSAIFLPDYISVGASGGIFGLIGACLADIIIHWGLLFGEIVNGPGGICRHILTVSMLILDIALNCLVGLTPFVDNWNHMGGLVYGVFCACLAMERVRFTPTTYQKSTIKDKIIPFLGAVTIFGGMLVSSLVLFTGDGVTAPCPVCQHLSCVPFPPWADMQNKWWYCDDCGPTTADARLDEETGLYDLLKLNCPDGTVTEVDLGDNATDDTEGLRDHLPYYCRLYCDKIYV